MGGDTLYSTGGGAGSTGAGSASGYGLGLGAAATAFVGDMNGPGMRNSGIVLPRVRDENQNGEAWIETGSEVTVLWP